MQRSFIFLIILLLGLVAGVYYIYTGNEQAKATTASNHVSKLLELTGVNLAASSDESHSVDSIRKIELISANQTLLNAAPDEGQWRAYFDESALGFPLQSKRLSTLVRNLSNAVIIETKSADPENHARLGLSSLDAPNSSAILLRVSTHDKSLEILIGKASTLQNGQYVRINNSDEMLLVDQIFDLPDDWTAWLQKDLFRFSVDDISNIQKQSNGKQQWELINGLDQKSKKQNPDQIRFVGENFTLGDKTETEKYAYPNIVGNYVESLVNMKFEQLLAREAQTSQDYESVTSLQIQTVLNQQFDVQLLQRNQSATDAVKNDFAPTYLLKINSPIEDDYVNDWLFVISREQSLSILNDRSDFLSKAKKSI